MQTETIKRRTEIAVKKYSPNTIENIKEKTPKIAKIIDKIKASLFINYINFIFIFIFKKINSI